MTMYRVACMNTHACKPLKARSLEAEQENPVNITHCYCARLLACSRALWVRAAMQVSSAAAAAARTALTAPADLVDDATRAATWADSGSGQARTRRDQSIPISTIAYAIYCTNAYICSGCLN